MIQVFFELCKHINCDLLLIGNGEKKKIIEQECKDLGIEDRVHFTGVVDDVENWLCAMDVFVFPSIFEGLGMVVIEAQASGLYCCVSDTVPKATKMSNNIEYISLNESPSHWADIILRKTVLDRQSSSKHSCECIEKNGYSIKIEAEKLRNIYLR